MLTRGRNLLGRGICSHQVPAARARENNGAIFEPARLGQVSWKALRCSLSLSGCTRILASGRRAAKRPAERQISPKSGGNNLPARPGAIRTWPSLGVSRKRLLAKAQQYNDVCARSNEHYSFWSASDCSRPGKIKSRGQVNFGRPGWTRAIWRARAIER